MYICAIQRLHCPDYPFQLQDSNSCHGNQVSLFPLGHQQLCDSTYHLAQTSEIDITKEPRFREETDQICEREILFTKRILELVLEGTMRRKAAI